MHPDSLETGRVEEGGAPMTIERLRKSLLILSAQMGLSCGAERGKIKDEIRALQKWGANVPSLARVLPVLERFANAADDEAPRALLETHAVLRSLRAALLTSGVDGPLVPLPRSAGWTTDLTIAELLPVAQGLVSPSTKLYNAVKTAVERGRTNDLRLVSPLLSALDGSYGDLAAHGLRSIGPRILKDVRLSFRADGKGAAPRLRILCGLDKRLGLDLCRELLETGSQHARIQAVKSLAEVAPHKEVIRVATALLVGRSNAKLRLAAVEVLGDLGAAGAPAVPILFASLVDKDYHVRWNAGATLSRIGSPAVATLTGGVNDGQEKVRFESIWALRRIGPEAAPAIEELLKAIHDPDWRIAQSALSALGRIAPGAEAVASEIDALLEAVPPPLPAVREAAAVARFQIKGWSKAVDRALWETLADPDHQIRWRVGHAAIDMGPAYAPFVPQLLASLKDEHPGVRRTAAEGLGCLGATAAPALPQLRELLSDPVAFVRKEVIRALERIGPVVQELSDP